MKGLPNTTEIVKQLPKVAVFKKFDISSAQQGVFDADVSKMMFTNIINTSTIPAIKEGEKVAGIFVLQIQLKKKNYEAKNITMLSRLIPQKMVYVLRYEDKAQLAIYHDRLICGEWMNMDDASIKLDGLTLDAVWENIVKSIGSIVVEEGNTLSEQIANDEEKALILKQIATLERKARSERQARRKMELFNQIKTLKLKL